MIRLEGRLRDAFQVVHREGFLPVKQRRYAHDDRALPIGHGQTNSQPSTVFAMLELLDVQPGDRVLDVGCGSGWTTALLGHLVGDEGLVHGVEVVPELVEFGQANLTGCQLPWTSIAPAEPGVLGLPDAGPFDRILVSAEAGSVPRMLVDQLAVGGTMVVPVAGRMALVRRTDPDLSVPPDIRYEGHFMFVPLVEP
jgi:protein-L-isoaspartate(D-aspartate) O-methyltransferase